MRTILIAALIVAGCAQTPKDIRERGDRFDLRSTAQVKDTAACLVHALENANGNIRAQWRETPAGYEVVASLTHFGLVVIADVSPAGSGSATAGYFDRDAYYSMRDNLMAAMRAC